MSPSFSSIVGVGALLWALTGLNQIHAADANAISIPVITVPTNTQLTAAADGDFTIGPDYTNAPEMAVKEGVPHGALHEFTLESTNSLIYPGISKTQPGTVPYHRRVAVYVPREYVRGTAAPFIVVQDGIGYAKRMATVLDNLIAEHRVPVLIAVLVNSGGSDSIGSERGLEYDTVSAKYTSFIETEVLPKVEQDYGVKFTTDPSGRATMGGSSGAACAFTMAWSRPDLYRRVLSYSGTYVNQQWPTNPASLHGAWEYHEHFIAQHEAKPIRVWLQVGEHDLGYNRDEASLHNWPLANERMAAALQAKGYHYQYVYCLGAKHVDGRAVGETLPEALTWLWEGYPQK